MLDTTTIAKGDPVEFTTTSNKDLVRRGYFIAAKPTSRGIFVKIQAEDDIVVTTRPSLCHAA